MFYTVGMRVYLYLCQLKRNNRYSHSSRRKVQVREINTNTYLIQFSLLSRGTHTRAPSRIITTEDNAIRSDPLLNNYRTEYTWDANLENYFKLLSIYFYETDGLRRYRKTDGAENVTPRMKNLPFKEEYVPDQL